MKYYSKHGTELINDYKWISNNSNTHMPTTLNGSSFFTSSSKYFIGYSCEDEGIIKEGKFTLILTYFRNKTFQVIYSSFKFQWYTTNINVIFF